MNRPSDNNSRIAWIDEAHFQQEVLSATQAALVAFLTPSSLSCQGLAPVLEEVAASLAGAVRVLQVDVNENLRLSMWYEIQAIPTILCFLNGRVCVRIVGAVGKEAIIAKLQSFLPARPSL